MTASAVRASRPLVLASAGIGVVGVTFGMARDGFGLLAPDIRASFGLTSGALGLLAAASYVAYLGTSLTAGVLSAHLGARAIVAAGGACAVGGMVLAGVAQSPGVLFAALLVAGASAGLVFPPFADVVAQRLPADRGPGVLAAISSGTGWGVALAAPVALLAGADWRAAWLLFALVAAAATGWAFVVLPGRDGVGDSAGLVRLRPRWFVCPRSGPLLVGGLLVGVASSVYWTFAVDHLVTDGGLSSAQTASSWPSLAWPAWAAPWAGMPCDARRPGRSCPRAGGRGGSARADRRGPGTSERRDGLGGPVRCGLQRRGGGASDLEWAGVRRAAVRGPCGRLTMNGLGLLIGPPVLGAVADRAGFTAVFAAAAVLLVITTAFRPLEPLR